MEEGQARGRGAGRRLAGEVGGREGERTRQGADLVQHAHVGAALKQQLHDGKMVVHRRVVEGSATVLRERGRCGRVSRSERT